MIKRVVTMKNESYVNNQPLFVYGFDTMMRFYNYHFHRGNNTFAVLIQETNKFEGL